MALTFCTLLSSQGTDAHLERPFGRSGGNRSNLAEGTSGVKPPAPTLNTTNTPVDIAVGGAGR